MADQAYDFSGMDDPQPSQATAQAPGQYDFSGLDEASPAMATVQPQVDTSAMKSFVGKNLQVHNDLNPEQHGATSFWESLKAGVQASSLGLALRGKAPDTVLPENSGRAYRIANQIGSLAGDFPAMIAGGFMGGMAGGAEGATVGSIVPGAGTAIGGVGLGAVGAASGAFALPAALRKIMMDHYQKGDIQSPGDFTDRLMGTAWEAIKGGVTGAATAVTGGAIGPVAGAIPAIGGELAAMTTVGAALEGHLPHAQDFIDGAIVLGGLHGVTSIAPKLRNIYAATGERPEQVIQAAQTNTELKQQLLSEDPKAPIQAQDTELKHFTELNGYTEKTLKSSIENAQDEKQATPVPPPEQQWSLVPKDDTPRDIDSNKGGPPSEPPVLSSDVKSILSRIGENPEGEPKSFQQKMDDFRQDHIDYLDALDKADKVAMDKGAEIPPGEGAYWLGRKLSSVKEKVDNFFENGVTNPQTGEKLGEGLYPILRDLHESGGNLDEFKAYGIAKAALDLSERKNASGKNIIPYKDFDKAEAQRVVTELGPKYDSFNKRRVAFENSGLAYARLKGKITPESERRMVAANENHFPLNKVQDPDIFEGKSKGGGQILKKIFGGDKKLLDPLNQTFRNFDMLITQSDIHEVRMQALKEFRAANLVDEGHPDSHAEGAYLRKVPSDSVKVVAGSEELSKALEKQGYDIEPDDITLWRREQGFLKEDQIMIPENGKNNVYEGTPGVIKALKGLEGNIVAATNFMKVAKVFATAERVGITTNPAFSFFAHPFRTQITGGLYSKSGLIPFLHPALAMKDFFSRGSAYQEFVNNGGAVAYAYKLRDNYLVDDKVYNANKDAPFIGKAWNAISTVAGAKAMLHKIVFSGEDFIKNTDNLTRFAEFQRLRSQGRSAAEAGALARDVVVDYQKRGLVTSSIVQATPFLSTHINSLDRMMQEIKQDPKGYAMKLAMLSTVSAMLWAVNKDDDAIQSLPDWQKNTYWNINLSKITGWRPDGTLPNGGQKAYIFRLPKPWAPGIIAGSGAEVALDAFTKNNPQEISHFVNSVFESVVPHPVPAVVSPILDQYSNKQSFTGRPLVSDDAQKRLPELQYEPYTSETAKQLAKLIGYVPYVKDIGPASDPLNSPEVVENYVKAWSGTIGQWALRVADYGFHKAGVGNTQSHSIDTIADEPFVSSFISRYPSFKDQDVINFYENKDKTDKMLTSIKWTAKAGDFDSAQSLMKLNPDLEVNLDSIGKGIANAKKLIQMVQDSNSSPIEKRQLIDTTLFQIGSMAKMGNQMMDEVKKTNSKKLH